MGKDGQEIAEFSVEFKAYPQADQSKISWIIYDASDDETTVLKPGDRQTKYEANNIQTGEEDNTFIATMRFINMNYDEDFDKTLTFRVEVKDGEFRNLELPFVISKPEPPTTTPKTTKKPVVIKDPVVEEIIVTTTESTEEVQKSGVSLYIIIAIIVLVILLCVLFYVTKWCRKKNKKELYSSQKGRR